MKIPVFIVEDGKDFAGAMKLALETQEKYQFDIVTVNPSELSFEETLNAVFEKDAHLKIILLDNHFDGRSWTGANLAPSFSGFGCALVSISSEEQPWAKFSFEGKSRLRSFYEFKEGEESFLKARAELMAVIERAIGSIDERIRKHLGL